MMKKLYYAYVVKELVGYYEKKLDEQKDKIKVIYRSPAISENGEPLIYYVLEAEEGIIHSGWELKNLEERD